MLLRASRASFAGLRVTESGSVAGSGAQPLLDKYGNNNIIIILIIIIYLFVYSFIYLFMYYYYYLTGAAPPNRPPSPIPLTRGPANEAQEARKGTK